MISTYNELHKFMEESTDIGQDAIDILMELDGTGSVVTQASLNDILVGLYNRLDNETIKIIGIGDAVTQEQLKNWVNDNFDNYTANLFNESV